ncbi:MAG: molybdenum ABC transporter ATP-binding protein [Geminicoccaceae bacterium]
MLEVDLACRLGTLDLQIAFSAPDGVTALFGRSGAGKTTIINCVAGLLRPDRGRIVLDGQPLLDTARRLDVPRHRRRIGYVFQDARLFPHLTVRRNLLYGQWFARGGHRRGSLTEVVELLGIDHLLERRPSTLSGGEKQRVAIGRALLADPRLLLLDEPLASLDQARKAEILPYLDRLCREAGIPILFVSHAPDEVARLATTMVLLSGGRVVAGGPVGEVMARLDLGPAGAEIGGGAVLHLLVAGGPNRHGLTLLAHPAGEIEIAATNLRPGSAVRLLIDARDVVLAVSGTRLPGISIRNQLHATVTALGRPVNGLVEVGLDVAGERLRALLTSASAEELGLRPGMSVLALVKSAALGPQAALPEADLRAGLPDPEVAAKSPSRA